MRRFEQNFKIHPVGQGLFYSCIINTQVSKNSSEFKFIFDCGSLTNKNGDEEVEDFRDSYFPGTSSCLDLLIISHFDADHINKIGRLLQNNTRVDKLVMPFTLFEERLFLTLRYLQMKGGYNSGDLFTINMMIDPIGTLGGNFDDGSTVYLITPGGPTSPDENEKTLEDFSFNEDLENDLEFDFNQPADDLSLENEMLFKYARNSGVKVKEVKDSVKANIHFASMTYIRLMEFLFYRKAIGDDEAKFYKEVYRLFCDRFGIDTKNEKDLMKRLVDAVKTIKGATTIKNLFKQAKKAVPSVKISEKDLLNMNTTALCMFHRNLPTIFSIFSNHPRRDRSAYKIYVFRIQKFDGTKHSTIVNRVLDDDYFAYYYRRTTDFHFPDTLLTSDSYLLQSTDVDSFFAKYGLYWREFWLFQIPHHGSKNNINRLLLAKLRAGVSKFINYGTRHQFEKKYLHPNLEVINDLIVTGQTTNVHAVNEFSGLGFRFICHRD
jgi:hypothetical protein